MCLLKFLTMRPVSFSTSLTAGESFKVEVDQLPYFYDRLHYHREVQLTLIVKGFGTFFVGDRMIAFEAGDVLMIGSNVPHLWKNDRVFYENESLGVHAISVHLNVDAIGATFFALPEMQLVHRLLKNTSRGISLKGELKEEIGQMLNGMVGLEGFERLLHLLKLLHKIAEREVDLEYLASINFEVVDGAVDEKLNRVFQFVMDNFHRPLLLSEVAGLANLSVSAFCRYFKLRTRKTFVRFLNEIRIGAACKSLRAQQLSITEICYQVGFNNLSNFNRQFKNVMNCTPSAYVKNLTQ